MKTDIQIQKDVMEELKWQPSLIASEIGVAVKNGIVTLSGQLDAYSKKISAENAARKVAGVKVIAEDIQIGVSVALHKTDAEIATAIIHALQWHTAVPEEKIKIKVENGNVTLEGMLEWEYQRDNVRSAVENITGVCSVRNLIRVKPTITASDIEEKISSAYHRSATIDSAEITATVTGSRVTLRGKVRSSTEKEDAEKAAWNAPGVTSVESKIEIEDPEYVF